MLCYNGQHRVVHGISLLATVLLTGSAIFGQSNSSARPRGLDQGHASDPLDWNDSPGISTESQQPHAGVNGANSNLVTFQELQHRVPKKAREEMEKGERARAKNQTDEAILRYKSAISIDPEYVAARNNLAAMYLRAAEPEAAIAQLEEAVKSDPRQPALFTNLAVGYTMIKNLEAAERAARLTVDLDRTSGRAPLLLGFVLIQQRKFTEEALQCFERVRDQYPLAHFLAAQVLVVQGHSERAKSELQTYLSSSDHDFRETANRWLDLINRGERKTGVVLPH